MSDLKISHNQKTIVISFCGGLNMSIIQFERNSFLSVSAAGKSVFIKNENQSLEINLPPNIGPTQFTEQVSSYIKKINRIERLSLLVKGTAKIAIICFALSSLLIFNDAIFRISTALIPSVPDIMTVRSVESMNENEKAQPKKLTASLSTTNSTTQTNYSYTEVERSNAKEISVSLQRGSATGDYSINLKDSGPTAAPLYVFSDPNCEHCQTAEPLLEELAKMGINVQIFPVSVIGQDFSAKQLISLLCLRGEPRVTTWRNLLNRNVPLNPEQPTSDCEAGKIALGNNNGFFAKYKFPGTPVFIRADGHQYPLDQPVDVQSLNSWTREGN